MPLPTDPTSPTYACDMATYLRSIYYNWLTGGAEKMIRRKGPNGEEEVQYSASNLSALQSELQKWEGLCAAATGTNPNRRFAIRGGSLYKGPY